MWSGHPSSFQWPANSSLINRKTSSCFICWVGEVTHPSSQASWSQRLVFTFYFVSYFVFLQKLEMIFCSLFLSFLVFPSTGRVVHTFMNCCYVEQAVLMLVYQHLENVIWWEAHNGWQEVSQCPHTGCVNINHTVTSGGSEDAVAACFLFLSQQMFSLCHGTTARIHHFFFPPRRAANTKLFVWSPWKQWNVKLKLCHVVKAAANDNWVRFY